MAGEAELLVEDGMGRLCLRRPEARNALTPALVEAAADELRRPGVAEIRALVLWGEGGAFCVGADLDLVREAVASDDPAAVLGRLLAGVHALVRALRAVPVPVVAAVEGAAAGAGMGLALAADLRVLGRSAVFVPAYLAIGASPDAGVSYHLARSLGGPRAAAVLLRNRRLPAGGPPRWGPGGGGRGRGEAPGPPPAAGPGGGPPPAGAGGHPPPAR